MKKRIICLLLSVCLLFSLVPAVSAYSNLAPWAQEAVEAMDSLGFLPEALMKADMTRNITRGEMCKMAVLVFEHLIGGYAYPASTNYFKDTKDPDICFAYEQGIISGYDDGMFRPNQQLTRQEFFKITYNLMGSAYCDVNTIPPASLAGFSDAGKLHDYAVKPTQIMVSIGVVQGAGDKLNPLSPTSCQEAILMFFRAYEYMCQWFNAQSEEDKIVQIYAQGYSGISDWAIREVMEMETKGMIPPCLSNCNMSNAITRAQMCSIAVVAYRKAMNENVQPSGKNYFTDCSDPDVNLAYELNIVGGYGDGKFGPNDTLTREQFFKIMANFMAALNYPRTDSNAISLGTYSDGAKVDDWARAATRLMIYIGAVRGDGKNLKPNDATSIQEAVAIFLRCFNFTTNWLAEHPDGEDYVETTLLEDLVAFAKSFVGYPYVYGGNGPNCFDCSGFVLYVYKHFGYSFSRGAQEQYLDGVHIAKSDLRLGDLVFFSGNGYAITHVGLYIGDGNFIHASNPTRGVVIDTLMSGYYSTHYWSACRIITD
ncbi:MAG: hypothetical protein E7467_02285 [Ruminococcaceae bacterium]|nr:hypothetical protein [Oscillospiraceae bacterium]